MRQPLATSSAACLEARAAASYAPTRRSGSRRKAWSSPRCTSACCCPASTERRVLPAEKGSRAARGRLSASPAYEDLAMTNPASGQLAPAPSAAGRHIKALDGLRGCAILLVILFHFAWAKPPVGLPSKLFVFVAS